MASAAREAKAKAAIFYAPPPSLGQTFSRDLRFSIRPILTPIESHAPALAPACRCPTQVNRVRYLKRQERLSSSIRRRRARRRWQVAVAQVAPQRHASPWCGTRSRRVTSRTTSPGRSPSSGCRATARTRSPRRRPRRSSSPRSPGSTQRKRLRHCTHTRPHGIEPALCGTHY